jgi:hypothetical protein
MRKAIPQGPVSLILTVTERPFCGFVTVSVVPRGQVRAVAVLSFGSNLSPLAVSFPEEYELARTSYPAQLPDRFTYSWTVLHRAASAYGAGTKCAANIRPKVSDHATHIFMISRPFFPTRYRHVFNLDHFGVAAQPTQRVTN